MAGWPRFRQSAPNNHSQYFPRGLRQFFPVRPAPVRSPAVKRPMPAGNINATSLDVKRMRTTSAVMPAVAPASTVLESSSVPDLTKHPCAVINLYRPGVVYQVVGESGPAHSKIFTTELIVDEQVFHATGESKAVSRNNVAQQAVDALRPKIEAELERRKVEREQKLEARKAEREERLQRQKQEGEGEVKEGTGDAEDSTVAGSDGNVNADDQETKRRVWGTVAIRVLKQIRPGVSFTEKVIPDAPVGHKYEAQVTVDGAMFEGHSDSLTLARALAAESALTTLFNLSFEYTPRGFPIYVGDPEAYMHLRQPAPMNASNEKNAIMILNELYYESAVYAEVDDSQPGSGHISVTVDGITAYGRGSTKKEAKLNAANAIVEQLRYLGLLQQQIAKKEAHRAEKNTAANTSTSEKHVTYRQTVCSDVPENAIAKLNRLYGPLNYNTTGTDASLTTGSMSYTAYVSVNGQNFSGTGRSKKVARLAASESVLRAFNLWTAEDDEAKEKARIAAQATLKTSDSPMSRGLQQPRTWRVLGSTRSVGSTRGFRGQQVPSARGVARGMSFLGRGAMRGRGSASSQTPSFPSTGFAWPARGRAPAFRARGSGMLSRGTRGRGGAVQGAAAHIAGPIEIPKDKNPIMLLNEIYYSAAVFEFSLPPGFEQQMEGDTGECTCTVTVDGITAYGTGYLKKDAKLNAATAAVQQLEATGLLQKRLADKAAFMSQKHALKEESDAAQFRGGAVQGSARMQRGRPTARGGRVPTARGGRVPTATGGRFPTARGGRVPTARGGRVSTTTGGRVLTARGGGVPTARGGRVPTARGGRVPTARGGRVAQMQGIRGRGVPSNQTCYPGTIATPKFQDPWEGMPSAETWGYPQASSADFVTPQYDSFVSFEDNTANIATSQFQDPWEGMSSADTWGYPQASPADFMTPQYDSFVSFENNKANIATSQFQDPRIASRGRQPAQGFNY